MKYIGIPKPLNKKVKRVKKPKKARRKIKKKKVKKVAKRKVLKKRAKRPPRPRKLFDEPWYKINHEEGTADFHLHNGKVVTFNIPVLDRVENWAKMKLIMVEIAYLDPGSIFPWCPVCGENLDIVRNAQGSPRLVSCSNCGYSGKPDRVCR